MQQGHTLMSGTFDLAGKRIFIAGDRGMVGSALTRRLAGENCHILTADRSIDLRNQALVDAWFAEHRPDGVIMAAARVGGILANDSQPAQFLYDNLMIAANSIEAARKTGVQKLLFLGSSCVYPKHAAQPITEDSLMTGPLEPTNEWYATAKISGIKLCQAYRRQYGCDFISAMPTNLYGPGDNYDPESSHVLPAMLRKAHEAKSKGAEAMRIWGSGTPRREFLHVDDLADAAVFLLRSYSADEPINVGSGEEISIAGLAQLVADIVGFEGRIERDPSKPDGTPRKLLDTSRLTEMGWSARIGMRDGIEATYRVIQEQLDASQLG